MNERVHISLPCNMVAWLRLQPESYSVTVRALIRAAMEAESKEKEKEKGE
jgi:hypothetical protein